MRSFVSAIESGNAGIIYEKSDTFLYPYTFIQNTVRYSLLGVLSGNNLLTDKKTAELSEKAVKAYENVALRHHYDLQARLNLIEFYNILSVYHEENIKKSEEAAGAAVMLAPNHPVPYYFLAAALAQEGKREQALATINKAVELNPELGKVHYYRGIVMFMLGDQSEARKNILKALQVGMREISDSDKDNMIRIIGETDFEKNANKLNMSI
jgi:tetratricopeptide (TPR) repeat protein